MPLECCIKKLLPNFIAFLLALSFTGAAGAATHIWSGGGAEELASNPGNWEGGVPPQSGSDVVFDDTSSKNCTWDLNITLSSFNISPGYEGSIIINADLVVDNPFTWTGAGGDTLASNPANWSGGAMPQSGDNLDFDGTKDCMWDLNISPGSLILDTGFSGTITLITYLSISGGLYIKGGLLDLNDKSLTVLGDIVIGPDGTLDATSSVIQLRGDWINSGVFIAGTSMVILNGPDQTIYGDNTFYNLVKTSAYGNTLYFESGRTLTVLNNLILTGTAGTLLSLRSSDNDTSWAIDPGGSRRISHTDIRDMRNINPVGLDAENSVDSGNTDNVYFDIDQCL
ncbi:MAG: hypothetical protein AB1499_04590 [Nitrospirota bacterium]